MKRSLHWILAVVFAGCQLLADAQNDSIPFLYRGRHNQFKTTSTRVPKPYPRRYPHRTDGQHHTCGGGGETVEMSHLSDMFAYRYGWHSPSSPWRGDTHAVQLTPYKRSAVWWSTRTSSSTTSPSEVYSVRNHRHGPPCPTPASTATPPISVSG